MMFLVHDVLLVKVFHIHRHNDSKRIKCCCVSQKSYIIHIATCNSYTVLRKINNPPSPETSSLRSWQTSERVENTYPRIYATEMSRSKLFVNTTDKYLTRKYTLVGNYAGIRLNTVPI